MDYPYKTDPSTETGESHLGSQPWNLASLSQEKQIESNGLELVRALLGRCPSGQISRLGSVVGLSELQLLPQLPGAVTLD